MKKYIVALLTVSVLAFLFLPASAFDLLKRNGWVSSGGGELFRDGKNAWFLRNTRDVNYCVKISSHEISASESEINEAIQFGFDYWKDEFSRAKSYSADLGIASQNFHRVSCDASQIDLAFLFGHGALTEEMVKHLVDPRKYVGVTVRTEFDWKQLRAKGFVFFSSDLGPLSYQNNEYMIKQAWSKNRVLRYAVLHELGHVFGVPHSSSGLMSEVFLQQLLNKKLVELYEKIEIEPFFQPASTLKICQLNQNHRNWFTLSPDISCLGLKEVDATSRTWIVFSEAVDGSQKNIGEIRGIRPMILEMRGKPAFVYQLPDEYLKLPEAEKIFTGKEVHFRDFIPGPYFQDLNLMGTYFPLENGKPKPLHIQMTSSTLSLVGQGHNGQLESVFSFNSPLGLLMNISPEP